VDVGCVSVCCCWIDGESVTRQCVWRTAVCDKQARAPSLTSVCLHHLDEAGVQLDDVGVLHAGEHGHLHGVRDGLGVVVVGVHHLSVHTERCGC
jgi:hypothetical protein